MDRLTELRPRGLAPSSYALVLLTLYYLQTGLRPSFFSACGGSRRNSTLASLYRGFFAFYATEFGWAGDAAPRGGPWSQREEVASVRLARRTPRSEFPGLRCRSNAAIAIEDPVDNGRDLADVLRDGGREFLAAIRRQHAALGVTGAARGDQDRESPGVVAAQRRGIKNRSTAALSSVSRIIERSDARDRRAEPVCSVQIAHVLATHL